MDVRMKTVKSASSRMTAGRLSISTFSDPGTIVVVLTIIPSIQPRSAPFTYSDADTDCVHCVVVVVASIVNIIIVINISVIILTVIINILFLYYYITVFVKMKFFKIWGNIMFFCRFAFLSFFSPES